MPHRQSSIFNLVESEHMVVLRLQWALWKCLGPRVALDGERFNRLVNSLAQELYDLGVRLPPALPAPIVVGRLETELLTALRSHPEFARDPRLRLARRVKIAASHLASVGYRKIVGLAGVLGIIALLPLLPC